MDCAKVALDNRFMMVVFARHCTKDRKEWRTLLHMLMSEFYSAIFAWFLCSFGLPFHALVADNPERGGMKCKMGATTY